MIDNGGVVVYLQGRQFGFLYGKWIPIVAPGASITSTNPSSLSESNIDEATVTVTLSNTTYVAAAELGAEDFGVSGPSGVTIDGVSRTSDTVAVLTLAYDDTDFDADAKLKVTVKDSGHAKDGDLETGETDVTAIAETAPAAPTGLAAAAANLAAKLSWTDPQNAGITGWEYRRKLGSESGWGPWMGMSGSGATTTKYTVAGLINGRAYDFQVRAVVDKAPDGAASETVPATPAAGTAPGTTVWRTSAVNWQTAANAWNVVTTTLLATETSQRVVFNADNSIASNKRNYAVYGCPWTSVTPSAELATPTGCVLVLNRGNIRTGNLDRTMRPTAEMIANGGVVFVMHFHSGNLNRIVYTEWIPLSGGAAITKTSPSSLTEENLNGAVVTVELSGSAFQSGVAASDFDVTGAPSGATVGVSSVARDSSDTDVAALTLSYTGDYDEAFSLGVRAKANGHTGTVNLETGTVRVAATAEEAAAKPTGLSAAAGDGEAVLTWTDPGDSTITGWEYQYKLTSDTVWGSWTAVTGSVAGTTTVTAGNLANGSSYDFRVRALRARAPASEASDTASATPLEAAAAITAQSADPLTESGIDEATVTVTVTNTTYVASGLDKDDFTLSAPNGVTIDGVSRTNDTVAVLTLDYDGTDFDADGKLKVTVKGTGHAGSRDLETGEIDVEAVAEVAPAKPSGLSAAPGDGEAVLTWTDPGDATITGWEYRYRTSGGVWGSWTAVTGSGAATTEATVGSLANGQAYDFQVRAVVAKASDGAASETVSATPDAPSAAITAQSATPLTESNVGGATVTVTLSRTTYVAGLTSSNFELVNAPAGVGIIRAGRTSDTVAVLTFSQDGTMDFDVDASMSVRVLDSGHAGSGNLDTGTVAVEAVVEARPSAPLGFRVEAADGAASLTWRDPGDSTIEGWEYRRKLSSGSWPAASPHGWTAVDGADAKNFRVTVTGLTNGSKYDFQLRALRDKAPAGTASATLSVTPSASVGATITATSPFPLTEDNLSGATVTVTLNAVKHANTSRSAGNFRLTGAPSGVGISAAAVGSDDSTTVLTLSYDGTDFDSDGRLGVRILAASHEGSLDIETGETVAITATDEKTPGKPSGLTAAAGDGEVELSWTGLGAAKVSKWEYRYRTSGDPTWGSWTGVTGSVDTTEATVPGLTNGQAYEFQVRGFRERASPEAGPASDTATATPVAPGASISSTDPSSLTEENLHGATVTVTLANAAYVSSGLDKDDFSLPSAPSGVTISGVVGNSATEAVLTLAYDGTDLSAAAKLSVRVLASGHQGTGNLDTGEVDVAATSGPEVSGVSVTSSPSGGASGDTYGPGETIEVAVSFTDPRMRVTLTQAGVRPYLELGIGTETRRAEYASVSRNVLRFRYEVVAADADADGISIGHNALAANTAVIGAGRGPRATVAGLGLSGFTVANDGDHKVDGSLSPPARPTGLSAAAGAAGEADLSWTDPQDSGITGWEYRYKTEGSSLWLEWTGVTGSVAGTTSATVDGLSGGQGYVFQVRSRNSDGASPASAESSAVTITGMSIRAASPPLSETGLDGEKIVVTLLGAITFNAALSATDFELVATGVSGVSITGAERRSGNAKAADLTLSYDGSDFDADGKLGVKVKGSAYGGTEELTTEVELSVSAVAEAAPLAIRDFSVYPRDGAAVLNWSHPTDTGVSYEYRYRKSGEAWGDWASLARAVSNTHAVSGLENGATYEFEFRGRTAKGGEGPVASATAVPNLVEASIKGTDPTTLTESNLNGATVTVELSGTTFNASISASDFEISGLTGLGIKATGGVSRTSATEAVLTLAYDGTDFDSDAAVRVKVLHGSHQRGGSVTAGPFSVGAVNEPAPAAPRGLAASAADTRVVLGWTDPGDPTITGWEVRRRTSGAASWGSWRAVSGGVASTTSHTETGLDNGREYDFQVRATNARGSDGGKGAASATVTATPTAPAASFTTDPSPLSETDLDGAKVKVTLSGTTFSDPLERNHFTVAGIAGLAVKTSGGVSRKSDAEAVLTLSYTGADLSANANFSVSVAAAGHTGSGVLAAGTATAYEAPPPAAPAGLAATAGTGMVTLRWNDPGNAAITGYEYRQRTSGGSWGSWTAVSGSGAATTSHPVTGLGAQWYFFQVRAVSATEGNGVESREVSAIPSVAGSSSVYRRKVNNIIFPGRGWNVQSSPLAATTASQSISVTESPHVSSGSKSNLEYYACVTTTVSQSVADGASLRSSCKIIGRRGVVPTQISLTQDMIDNGGIVFVIENRTAGFRQGWFAKWVPISAPPRAAIASTNPASLTLGNLDGAKVTVELSAGTAFESTLLVSHFSLLGGTPSNISISAVSRRGSSSAVLTLESTASFSTNRTLGIRALAAGHSHSADLDTGTVAVRASRESATITSPSSLEEASLNGASVTVTLAGVDFQSGVGPGDFELLTAPSGMTVRSASRDGANHKEADLVLNYTGADFDSAKTLSVRVKASGHTGSNPLTTGTINVSPSPEVMLKSPNPTVPPSLTEENLDGAKVTVELSGTALASSPSASHFRVTGLSGLGVKSPGGARRVSSTEAELTLAYDGRDFDSASSFRVKVLAAGHTGSGDLETEGRVSVSATVETTPGAPTGFTAAGGVGRAVLRWTAPAGASVTGWEYRRKFSSLVNWDPWTAIPGSGASTSEYTVPNLVAGSEYQFQVRAVNAKAPGTGKGAASDTASATPTASGAAISSTSPSSLTETNLDNATVTVELTATTYEAAIDKTDFELPSKPPGVTIDGVSRTNDTVAVLTLDYDDTDFDADAKLRVRVLASGYAGGTDIETGEVNVAAVAEQAAAKPTGLTAAAGDEEAELRWTNPSDSLVTGYEYQSRTGGSWPASWTEMTGSGAATTKFSARGLANGQGYDFRIRALRAKADPSPASDAASATPVADAASISSTFPSALTEANLNNSRLTVTLSGGTEFNSSIGAGDFEVSGAPSGTTVSLSSRHAPRRLSATEAHVFLSYGGENFDSDWTLRLAVKSTGHDGGSDLAATVRVAAEDESVALSTLSVQSGQSGNFQSLQTAELKPPFVSSTTAYRATAPLSADTAIIAVRPKDSGSRITIGGSPPPGTGGWSRSVFISQGENTIPIVVTSSGGSQKTYTLVVRRGSANALLSALRVFAITKTDGALEVRSEPRLSPHFQSAVGSYSAKVAETITKVRIRPLANHPAATITVAGTAVANNTMSGLIDLAAVGTAKAIDVVVTPEDTGASAKTYRISITREAATITPSATSVSAEVGTAITSVAFTVGGEGFSPDLWSVDKALPSGLSMDPETGTISGTPRRASPAADYEVRASSAASSVTAFGQTLTHKASATVRIGVDTVVSGAGVAFTGTTGTGSARSLSVNEGQTATYTVALTVQPSGPVTLTATASGSGDVTVNPQSLTFTTADWSSPKTITVTAASDGDAADDSASIAHEVTGGGYDGAVIDGVAVTVDDDEEVAVKTSLSSLSVNEGSDGTYTVTLGSAPTAQVTVAPTVSGSGDVTVDPATLTFDSTDWSSPKTVTVSAASDSDAEDDSATITHSVSSSDGNYNGFSSGEVSVAVSDSEKADLSALGLSSGTLSPAFGPKTTSYATSVVNSVARVTVTATARVSSATVSITPADADSGTDGHQVALATQQATTITVKVTAADGTEKDYSVAVTRAQSVAPSSFSFTAETGAEPGSVATSNAITVSGIEAGSAAISITSGGTLVVGGSDFTGSTVSNGDTVAVKLTASSSFSTEVKATVTIGGVSADFSVTTRAASSNANLSALTLSDGATLNQTLDSTRTSYTARVPASVRSKIKVRPTAADSGATIKVNRAAVTSGEESGYIYFPPRGFSRFGIVIEVTAEDGTTKKRYTLRLSRQSSDATLGAVSVYQGANTQGTAVSLTRCVSGATQLSAFARSATSCSARVPTSVSSVTVVPQTSDPRATVKINGTAVTRTATGTLSPTTVTLSGGTTTVSIEVTPEDASAGKKTYAVVVTKREVTASQSAVTVAEAGGTGNYTVVLDSAPTGTVTVTPMSGDADVATVSGALEFTTGNWSAPQQVTVTGQNDDIDNSGDQRSVTITHSVSGGDYDGAATPSVSVTVSDDDTAGITTGTVTGTITEAGGQATFTVELDSEPEADVIIAVSSGDGGEGSVSPTSLTFTSGDWDTTQTVTVTGQNDDVDDGDQNYDITLNPSSTGDTNYNGLSDETVSVTTTDDDTKGVTVSKSSVNVTEGNATGADYTVVLDTKPSGNVTVDISTGSSTAVKVKTGTGTAADSITLTFTPTGTGIWSTAQTVTVTAVDDVNAQPETVTITQSIGTGSASEYSSVNVQNVTVNVSDNDTPGVSISEAGVTVTEASGSGRTATYTVALNTQPSGNVTVTPSTGASAVATVSGALTFTPQNYGDAQTVTVTGVDNKVDNPSDLTTTITHSVAGYGSVTAGSVNVTLTDDDTKGVTISTTGQTIAESGAGNSFAYTVVLDSEPTAQVTVTVTPPSGVATVSPNSLTFTAAGTNIWSTAQQVTVTAVDDEVDNASSRTGNVTHSVSGGDYGTGVSPAAVSVTLTDDDTAGVTISETGVTVTEATGSGRTATYTVVLDSAPAGTVTVTPATGASAVAGVSGALTFTTSNWKDAQTVTVTGVDNDVDNPSNLTTTITHAVAGYGSVTAGSVNVTLTDDDAKGVTISPTSLTLAESGGSGTYTVVLDSEPTAQVTVAVTPPSGVATVSPSSLTFDADNTNNKVWSAAQTVTVTAVDDSVDNPANRTGNVTHSVSGGDYGTGVSPGPVSVTLTDDDTAGVTVSKSSVNVTEQNATGADYTVVLDSKPSGNVTVNVSTGASTAVKVKTGSGTAADSIALTFTPTGTGIWSTAQTVTVTAADDVNAQSETVTITQSIGSGSASEYSSVNVRNVTVNVTDNDTPGVSISETGVTVTEATGSGRTATYTVALNTQPSGNVTVTPSTGASAVATVSGALTFTPQNYGDAQTVTVTGVDNKVDNPSDLTTSITHSVAGYGSVTAASVDVTLTDDDAKGVTISKTGETIAESGAGNSFTYTVVLDSEPTGTVTVAVNAPSGVATVSPNSLTFTAAGTNIWSTAQQVTVTAVDDDVDDATSRTGNVTHTVTGADYAGESAASVSVTLTDDDTRGVTISPTSLTLAESGAGSSGTYTVVLDSKPTNTVTVTVTAPSGTATVSANSLTFTTSNWKDAQTVTVTAVDDNVDNSANRTGNVTHSVSGGDYGSVTAGSVSVTLTDDDTRGVTISPTSLTLAESGGSGSYTVVLDSRPTSSVTVTVTAPSGVATVSANSLTFTTSNWNDAQTVTVTAVDDNVDNSANRTGNVTHSVSGGDYGSGVSPGSVSVTLTDDDAAGVTVSKSSVNVTEQDATGADYTVVLDTKPSGNVTVNVSTGTGTAVKVKTGSGSAADSITLTFTPTGTGIWSTAQTVTVTAADDQNSVAETVTITHSIGSGSASDYSSVTVRNVTVNVTDNDAPGVVVSQAESTPLAIDEGSSGSYDVRLATQPASDVTVVVSSGNSDVTVSKDSGTTKSSSVTLTFKPTGATELWSANQTVTVDVAEDSDSLDETASITHTIGSGSSSEYSSVSVSGVTVNVTDNDYAGLSIADVSASEGSGRLDFTVTLSMASSRTVTVDWALVTSGQTAGTATAGTATTGDYDASTASGTLTFSSGGSLTQTVPVPINDDFDVEGDETVKVALSNQSPSQVGVSGSPATGTITDDDEAGVSVSPERALRNTTEDDAGTVEFRVALSSRPTADVTITVTSSDTTEGVVKASDEDPDPTLVFTPTDWNTAQTVTVTGVDDDELDGDAEYNIRLAFSTADAPGGDADYRELDPVDVPFTNLDDDLSILSVSGGGEVTEGDSGSSAQAEFTVTLEPERRQEVSVSYATADGTAEAGSDYVASSGTVTFSPGETSKTVAVTINGDDEAEGNETFTLSLTETPNGQIDPQNSSAEAVIVNDDEKMVDASMSGEFSVGDTMVTVDSTLPADTGLEIVLPSELESGGSMIEELTVTLGPTDQEIDSDLFGYTGANEDHVLVDIDVSPIPDSPVKVCLPITEGLRRAAGEQRLYLIRFSGGSWEELSSTTEGDMVCASVSGFSPFALVYQIDYAKRRFGEVNRAILPELSRAMTASTLEAVTARIEDAMAGGAPANSLNASAPAREEFGHALPRLRLGEFEDGETISLLDSIDGSRFSVSLAGGYDPPAAESPAEAAPESLSGGLGMWISGDYRSLSGGSGGPADWDGRLISGHMGADYRFGRRFLAGVATSWSQGSFDYTGRGESGRVSGEYGSRMNSFHPYLGLSLSRRLDVWASGGWGFGEIRMDDGEISGRQKAAARQGTLAAGANIRLSGAGATSLSLKGEAWMSRMRVKDNGGRIEGLKVGTDRLRAALEGSHALALGSGSSLVPSLEFGIRRDGGDGETGAGGELGGGITFASSFGLSLEARGRTLLFHQGDTKEWGVGGSVRFDPGGDGRGLSMSALPTYGNGSSGIQTLWDGEKASDFAASGSGREFGLETEVGYGFSMFGDSALLTPYGAFGRPDPDSRNYRFGSRFSMNRSLDLTLEGQRREIRTGTPEHELTVRGRLNW